MNPDPNIGSEAEFDALVPIPPASGETLWEFDEIPPGTPVERVWTIVDDGGETESWYACPGYHLVNRMGYMLTEQPWTDEGQSYYWFFDDRDRYAITLSNGDVEYEFGEDEDDALQRFGHEMGDEVEPGVTVVAIGIEEEA